MLRLLLFITALLITGITDSDSHTLPYQHPGLPFTMLDYITENRPQDQPQSAKLDQNYPNPFNPATTISYSIPRQSQVRIDIYNLLGRHLEALVHDTQHAGSYAVSFDASHLASGTYIYRMELIDSGTGNRQVYTRKLTLIK